MWKLTKIVLADTNESALSETKLEELADQELYQKVLARMAKAIASKCLSRALLTTIHAHAVSVLLPNALTCPSSTVRRLF
jgi:uncharacterized hydantoinase/oxoprolinase family protein